MRTMCVKVDLGGDPVPASVRSETIVEVLGGFTPGVEILEPGEYLIPVLGPARYHGGEDSLARQVHDAVSRALVDEGEDPSPEHPRALRGASRGVPEGRPQVTVVVAGGPLMALLVASVLVDDEDPRGPGRVLVLGEGEDVGSLAPMPIRHLGHLIDPGTLGLFQRLGLGTIGAFADLAPSDIASRFGPEVAEVHRIVNGFEREPSRPDVPMEDMCVTRLMEPPLETVDQVAFVARAMADDLVERLSSSSLAADTVLIAVEMDDGARMERVWRARGGLSVSLITQRVRWQIEGWLRSRQRTVDPGNADGHSDVGAISALRMELGDIRPYRGEQIGFWGETDDHDRLVMGGIDRIRGLFGADAVRVPGALGGRSPHQSHRMVDIDDPDATVSSASAPWPGSIPDPFPTRVWKDPIPAEVVDAGGTHVGVSGRGVISSAPVLVSIDGGPWSRIIRWAGPWCIDERWWDPLGHRRKARIQVLVDPVAGGPDGTGRSPRAHLLTLEVGRWWLEATYD